MNGTRIQSLWEWIAVALVVLVGSVAASGKAIYVDANAPGADNGTSWENAYNFLQDALADANSSEKPVEVWVAQGIYTPDSNSADPDGNGDQTATFQLINGVTLKGGYAGFGETDPNARDIVLYETVLSGDLAGNDVDVNDAADLPDEPSRTENSLHVVTGSGTDANAVLDGFTIAHGRAIGLGVKNLGGGMLIEGTANPTVINCLFCFNTASQGGGMHCGGAATPAVSHCKFAKNAASHAGALKATNRGMTVNSCTFTENLATTDGGAGIFGSVTIIGCTFTGNSAGSEGGAVDNDCSAPTFDHCRFIENTAPFAGGAISNFEGDLTITYCTFNGNSSDYGGAIYQGDQDSILTGCKFIANSANEGGAIANDGYSDPVLTECSFTGNNAKTGGAFYNTTGSAPKLINCTFNENLATNRGGSVTIYNNYGYSPLLIDCTFRGNSAAYGAGVYNNYEGDSLLKNCTFVANRAWEGGGGMCNFDSNPTMNGCRFSGNIAGSEGAAVYNGADEYECHPTMNNCIFSGNIAARAGGAMYNTTLNKECRVVLLSCTFAGNFATNGNALACDSRNQNRPSTMEIDHCILWDGGDEIWNNDNSTITVIYSDVEGCWPGQGNIDTDPCFVLLGYWDPNETPEDANDDFWVDGDYHLKSQAGRWDANNEMWIQDDVTSPCIDAGGPMSPIALEPFPNSGRVNMGAYGGTTEASKSYFGEPVCETIVAGDINGDCKVNFLDFRLMASRWMNDYSP